MVAEVGTGTNVSTAPPGATWQDKAGVGASIHQHVPRPPSDASRSLCALRDTPDARAAPSSELEPQRARGLYRDQRMPCSLKEAPGPVLRAPLVAELWVRRGRTDSRNSVASKRAWPSGSVSDAGRARGPTETFEARD